MNRWDEPAVLGAHPAIKTLLCWLLTEAQRVLGSGFTGLYLHGSLAGGDFHPHSSDIDFLVVTTSELSDETIEKLRYMHQGLTNSGHPWAQRLEGSYIPRASLRRHWPGQSRYPALSIDGKFGVDDHGSDWVIQRHILRTHGIALAGPPLPTLIDPVAPHELRQAAAGILNEWWSPPFPDPGRFEDHHYRVYAVLTMCRALHTVSTGRAATKPEAAGWALRELGLPWSRLVERALELRTGTGQVSVTGQETFDFIGHVLDLVAKRMEPASKAEQGVDPL